MNTREEIDKILTDYIKLFGKVKENFKIIDYAPAVKAMQETILKDFNQEVDCFNIKASEHYKSTKFALYDHEHQMTPHRCGFLWLRHNRIKKLIWREVEAEVESTIQLRTLAVEQREEEIFPSEPEEKHQSFWQRLFRKKDKPAAMENSSQSGSATPAQPSEPSTAAIGANGVSDAAREQLEEIIKQADQTPHAEAFEQPEPPTAPPTLDTPPAPVQPNGKPKKQQRNTKAEPTAEPPTAPNASEQLTGQINIDEIAGNK